MKAILVTLMMNFTAPMAQAQTPSELPPYPVELHGVEEMTCAQVRQFVHEKKMVLIFRQAKFAPVTLYTIIYPVKCPSGADQSRPLLIETRDNKRCVAGLYCAQDS